MSCSEIDASYTRYRLLMDPTNYQPAADLALKECVNTVHDPDRDVYVQGATFYVGFKGSFGDNHTTPRTLRADKLGKMVCLEGIVTRCEQPLSLFFSYSPLYIILNSRKRMSQVISFDLKCTAPSTFVPKPKTSTLAPTPIVYHQPQQEALLSLHPFTPLSTQMVIHSKSNMVSRLLSISK